MDDIHNIRLKRLQGQLGDLVYHMTKVQFTQFSPPKAWSPALNAYRCDNCIVVCVDLAGVDKAAIGLQVESQRLLLRGRREAPEPKESPNKPVEILAMEIDYGSFEREVRLPVEVEPERVTAEHQNGLLWIYLPVRAHG